MSTDVNSSFIAPASSVLEKVLETDHVVSLSSSSRMYPLPVEITHVNSTDSTVSVKASCDRDTLTTYLSERFVSLDIEVRDDGDLAQCYLIDDIEYEWQFNDSGWYEVICRLSPSPLITGRRGGVRIPFVHGMTADVALNVFDHELTVKGHILDLSSGGCRVQIPINESYLFSLNQTIHRVSLEFPNGESYRFVAQVRHIRAIGTVDYLALGLQFIELDAHSEQRLLSFVNEAEMELAFRTGSTARGSRASRLFQGKRKAITRESHHIQKNATRVDSYAAGIKDVARQLHIMLIALKAKHGFPSHMPYAAGRDLLSYLENDRKRTLYSLAALNNEPLWVRQSIRVAAYLGDLILSERQRIAGVLDAVVGALMHNMGKPLLISADLPSLDMSLSKTQRSLLRKHVGVLLNAMSETDWRPEEGTVDVIVNINERLDGSGYPAGKSRDQLTPLAILSSVVKNACKLMDPGQGQVFHTPSDAYISLYRRPDQYAAEEVMRLAKRQGLYPLGSLLKYSQGFLAWVMEQDKKGIPSKALVVKNLAYPEVTLNTIISGRDFEQIGEPEKVVNPVEMRLSTSTKM